MNCNRCQAESLETGAAGVCQWCGEPLEAEGTLAGAMDGFLERLRRFGLGDVHRPIFRELRRKPRGL